MKLERNWIGRTVDIMVDRPLGSCHPRYPEMIYPVNYGYIAGTMADDGEPIDVYVLGIDKPLDTFSGQVIAIIRRRDDVEDKLVVAAIPIDATEIKAAVAFQEQYFDSKVEV